MRPGVAGLGEKCSEANNVARSLAVMFVLVSVAMACGGDDDSSEETVAAPASTTTTAPASSPSSESSATPASTPSSESSAAPATSATSSAEWDEIVAKAQDEGNVTIYSSQGLDLLNELAAKFEEKYGIALEVVRGIDSELIPKVDAETQTGNRVADVFAFASPQWGKDNAAKGLFVAPTGPSFDDPAFDKASLVLRRRHRVRVDRGGVRLRLEHRPLPRRPRGL